MILREIINKFDKSSIKAGDGIEIGQYPLYTCSPLVNKFLDDYKCDDEAIIVSTGGNFSIHYVNGKFNYSTDCYVFNTDKCNLKYLYYYLKSKSDDINKMFRGAGLKHLNKNEFVLLNIKELKVEKQVEIVNQLDRIQNLIEIKKEQITKCDNLVKSQFVEMFGDMVEYKLLSFKECTNFVDYRGHTPKVSDVGDIRMINAKSVGKGYFKYVDEFVTEKVYNTWMHRGIGYPGDILFVTEGHTFGNSCIIPNDLKKFALGQRVITIKSKEFINNRYLNCYMQTKIFMDRINVYKTGGTAQGIRSKDLLKVDIPIPPLGLQNKFANIVELIDKQKFEFENNLKKLEEMQNALMQEYFG